ncbi:unnamed protein product [Onchocerca flexuosa]|uniref:Secreted protein n=1 Tax=Onchocerca flexuosa TaxID=387005 RepID=A0A183H111_9BILA|nr:unnamed protein product [Onchocerca flexuosa]
MDAFLGTVYINVVILDAARYTVNITRAAFEFTIQRVGCHLLHCVSVSFIATTMEVDKKQLCSPFPQRIVSCCGDVYRIIRLEQRSVNWIIPDPGARSWNCFHPMFNRLATILSLLVLLPSKHWSPAPFLPMFIFSMIDFLLYFSIVPDTRGNKLLDPGEVLEKELTTHKSTVVAALIRHHFRTFITSSKICLTKQNTINKFVVVEFCNILERNVN